MVLPMASSDPSERSAGEPSPVVTQPVVIRQGGDGLVRVIAAVVLAAAATYNINVWSAINKETSPAKKIERIKDAAGKAIESRN